jgi:hypothetical protein
MMTTLRWSPPSLSALTLLVLASLPGPVRAGDATPFKGTFNFALTDVVPTPVDGVLFVTGSIDGNETHLGRITGEVQYYYDTGTGSFYGTLSKTAANGDALSMSVAGQFTTTGSFGTFTITGGTGRFTNATGAGTFVGRWINAPITAVLGFDGTISYDASDRRHPKP